MPLIHATIARLGASLFQSSIPALLFRPLDLLGQAIIPLMLVSLGYRLYSVKSLHWGHALGGALVRIIRKARKKKTPKNS